MIYLESFTVPSKDEEWDFFMSIKRKCYTTFYPFDVLTGVGTVEFEPVTIFCGSNGSGKSTLLNVMAESVRAERKTLFNRSSFYGDYLDRCSFEMRERPESGAAVITSDDVFDFMLDLRNLNEGIDSRREEMFDDYVEMKTYRNRHGESFHLQSLDDYETLRKMNEARSRTQSSYVRRHLGGNVREHSNGESAFTYFSDKIKDNGLYLLDEPENSLSPALQQKLSSYLYDAARYFGCQLIIATHSPFVLSIPGARIYDMDENPVRVRRWTEIPGVRSYYDFFREHAQDFERKEREDP